ncbi:MAG: type III pantothenate kinase, partial [Tannerellaceae bacterium]|nr:type III pantothenate kinase [Tannerellaceae bacterium]
GNTSTKVALFDKNGSLVNSFIYKEFKSDSLLFLLDEYRPSSGILSTVIRIDPSLLSILEERLDFFMILDEHVRLPIQIGYETPDSLGKDRLAAAVGAFTVMPGRNLLVIDAGTAITYEVIEASGIYIGGNISPGMSTRFKALHTFTSKLPLVEETDEVPLIGFSTTSALQAGVVNGIIFEMDGYINELKIKYPDLFVFLTGGHSFYFERRLKNSIFANINLVLTGLNTILESNRE